MLLEVCVDTLESALTAQKGGADRIELCGDLSIGGVTPSLDLIQSAADHIDIPIMMMVRPRGGNFCYNEEELQEMESAIDLAKIHDFQGVVFGVLDEQGDIDIIKVERLIHRARPMEVTFHRAYDECNDPLRGIDDLISLKVERLLTSGQRDTAIEGIALLETIVEKAQGELIVMPGSGVSKENILELKTSTRAVEYHGSCKGEDGKTSAEVIQDIKSKLNHPIR